MFTRIRTIKGHRYRYSEGRWREGRRVRSESLYLGRAGDGVREPPEDSSRQVF
jgi:hypothetical protein